MDSDLVILSPEKTILTYRIGGLGPRIVAHIADLLIIIVSLALLGYAISLFLIWSGALRNWQSATSLIYLYIFVAVFGPFTYFILFEGLWNGLTPGKKISGIRVQMSDGTPITFAAALGRNLLRPADILPGVYLVGVVATFLNPRSQRIGDLVANTVVIHEKRSAVPYSLAPHSVGIHPMESEVGDLPGMTMDEYVALRRLCDRYPELAPEVQQKFLNLVWLPIATARKVPENPKVHPLFLAEAMVMKYGRTRGLL